MYTISSAFNNFYMLEVSVPVSTFFITKPKFMDKCVDKFEQEILAEDLDRSTKLCLNLGKDKLGEVLRGNKVHFLN